MKMCSFRPERKHVSLTHGIRPTLSGLLEKLCMWCDPIILACMGDDIQLVKSDSLTAYDAERQMNLSGSKIAQGLGRKEIVSDG